MNSAQDTCAGHVFGLLEVVLVILLRSSYYNSHISHYGNMLVIMNSAQDTCAGRVFGLCVSLRGCTSHISYYFSHICH